MVSIERLVVGVELGVAAGAEQGELVEVGRALGRGIPWREMVGLALLRVGAAFDAAFVSQHERVALHEAGVTAGSAKPEGLAVAVVENAEDVGVFEVVE